MNRVITKTASVESALASWAGEGDRRTMRDLVGRLAGPGIISFAHAMPAPELFPATEYAELTESLLRSDPGVTKYQGPCRPLKAQIVKLMAHRGVVCSEDEVFLTAGAQHATSLLAWLLLEPGESFILESTVYEGVELVTRPFQPSLLTVPSHPSKGIDVSAVGELLHSGARPRFIYVIPDGHNPTGASLPVEERARLVRLAAAHGVPIIEDDPYGLLGFDRGFAPPLRALNSEWVLYVGSFSKILAPSLRLGWIVAHESLARRLSEARQASDMDVAGLAQRIVAEVLSGLDVATYLERLRSVYAAREAALADALENHFPSGTEWHRPRGGMLTWVELPTSVDTADVLLEAVEREQVSFLPGAAFARGDSKTPPHAMRLAFAGLPQDRITDGIERLGRLMRRACR